MDKNNEWKMTPLDAMLCSNQLQILKSLVFFFPAARQRQMIFLVKLMELRQCLSMPLSAFSPFSRADSRSEPGSEIFENIFPYCDSEKQQFFRQMQNAFQMMRTVRQFSDSGMFDHFGEMMGGMGGFDAMNMFSQMAGQNNSGDHSERFDSGHVDSHHADFHRANSSRAGTDDEDISQTGSDYADTSRTGSDYADAFGANTDHSPENGRNHFNAGNDQLASMLSSMMNPEQQALFAQYESMLDDLQIDGL